MTAPRTRPPGEVVGSKYRLLRFLASGGMGSVYEAQHTVVKRRFAVKFLRADLAVDRASLARFQREAQAAGALESEHIAAAVDFGIADDGAPFIVMEYLVGESLASLLEREKRLPVGRAVDLVVQACRGVEAAHASGIVHRDLKPQNLFVARRDDGTDVVKILDFGVAKLEAEDHGAGTTRTGTVLGTPAYMSPEQARGDKVVDQRSDVYSLGAVLYELLSGEKPHPGDSPNAILYHIASHPPVPLASTVPELPAALVEGIEKALSREPGDRPASAAELAETLKPFAVREVHPAPKLEPSSPTSPSVAATELAAAQAAPSLAVSAVDTSRGPSSEKPSRRAASALVWVALGAGLAVAIGWAGRQRTDEAGQTPETRVMPPAAAGSGAVAATPTPAIEPRALPTASVVEPPAGSVTRTVPGSPPGRPSGRPSGRPAEPARAQPAEAPGASAAPTPPAPSHRFDQRNPYDQGP